MKRPLSPVFRSRSSLRLSKTLLDSRTPDIGLMVLHVFRDFFADLAVEECGPKPVRFFESRYPGAVCRQPRMTIYFQMLATRIFCVSSMSGVYSETRTAIA